MRTDLIDSLSGRRDADTQAVQAFQEIDAIIRKVYVARYHSLEPEFSSSVDFAQFSDLCMAMLGSGEMVQKKLAADAFANDGELKAYFRKVCENLLNEMAKELTPGLATRQKQVRRLLKQTCESTTTRGRRYWRLKRKPDAVPLPGTELDEYDGLRACAHRLPVPEPKYARRSDASYQPAYADADVQRFLNDLIEAAGGMVSQNGLLNLIKDAFGLAPIQFESATPPDDDSAADYSGEQPAEWDAGSEAFLSFELIAMARDVMDQLNSVQRDVLYWNGIRELTLTQIKSRLGFSPAKTSGINKQIETIFRRYLHAVEAGFSQEESKAVIRQVYHLIASEKEGDS